MPGGRVKRKCNDPEFPLGQLRAPPHVGHASGPGVREPPPPALPQIIYVCSLERVEHEASCYGDVRQMRREETQAYEGGGSAIKHDGGLPVLWDTSGVCDKI